MHKAIKIHIKPDTRRGACSCIRQAKQTQISLWHRIGVAHGSTEVKENLLEFLKS